MRERSDLRRILDIAARRWIWLAVIPPVCAAIAFGIAQRQNDVFQASADIRIEAGTIATDVALITSQEVNSEARIRMGAAAQDVLAIDTSAIGDTQIARITARSTSAESAALAANVWAEAFADIRNEGESSGLKTELQGLLDAADLLLPQLLALEDDIAALEAGEGSDDVRAQLADLRSRQALLESQQRDLVDRATGIQSQLITTPTVVTITNAASEPRNPVAPQPQEQALFGLVAGMFLAVIAAAVAERLDDRIWDIDRLNDATGDVPVLASIPPDGNPTNLNQPITVASPRHPASEAYRMLRAALRSDELNHSGQMILVTSASSDDGVARVAANLAVMMARSGEDVLFVQLDARQTRRQSAFGVPPHPGFVDIVAGRSAPDIGHLVLVGQPGTLTVLPLGQVPDDPSEFMGSREVRRTLDEYRKRYGRIVMEGAGLLGGTDAIALAQVADAVVLTVRHRRTHADDVAQAVGRLEQAGLFPVGTVVLDVAGASYPVGASRIEHDEPRVASIVRDVSAK